MNRRSGKFSLVVAGFMLSRENSSRLSSWRVSATDGSIMTESSSENVLFISELRHRQKDNNIK